MKHRYSGVAKCLALKPDCRQAGNGYAEVAVLALEFYNAFALVETVYKRYFIQI